MRNFDLMLFPKITFSFAIAGILFESSTRDLQLIG
jgi:hypothetical protein